MSIKFLSKNKIAVLVSLALSSTCLGAPAPTTQDKKWFASFGAGYGSLKASVPNNFSNGKINIENASVKFNDKSLAYNMAIGYFFIPSIAVEASIGGFFQTLDYEIHGSNITPGLASSTGRTTLLMPISLALQYHIRAIDKITPYLGVGYSYQLGETFKSENTWSTWIYPFGTSNKPDETEIEGGGGVMFQAGVDFALDHYKELLLNLDVKYTHKVKHDIVMSRLSREISRDPLKISTLAITAGIKAMF